MSNTNYSKKIYSASSYLEPIYGAAVDEWGELSESVAESVSNRTESYNNVKILSASRHKICK